MNPNAVTASRIKQLRENANISQEEFAQQFSDFCSRDRVYTVMAISCWESGRKLPPADVILQLTRFYGCSADYLLGLSNDPKQTKTSDKIVNLNQRIEIPFNELSKHNKEALYVTFPDNKMQSQFGLLDYPKKQIVFIEYKVMIDPRCHYYITVPPEELTIRNNLNHLLNLKDVMKKDRVYIESLSPNPYMQALVSGWYRNDISGKFLINEAGRCLSYEGLGVNYNAIDFKTSRKTTQKTT